MKIRICPDLETLSHEAAAIFCSLSSRSIAERGKFKVALSGGSTPLKFYSILASEPYRHKIDWHNIHIFWADERFVDWRNRASNYRLIHDTLLKRTPLTSRNLHPVRTNLPGPSFAADNYEEEIKHFFTLSGSRLPIFDLVMLGLGEDGHTASLFPGTMILKEKTRVAGFQKRVGKRHARITLTLPVINNARNIIFLVSGTHKSAIAARVIEDRNPNLPASLVVPSRGSLMFLLDEEAASLLENSKAVRISPRRGESNTRGQGHC